MKINQKAEQKNVVINTDYYTEKEIERILRDDIDTFFFYEGVVHGSYKKYTELKNEGYEVELRVFTSDMKTLNVVLDKYGFYTTVAVMNNGHKYFVSL